MLVRNCALSPSSFPPKLRCNSCAVMAMVRRLLQIVTRGIGEHLQVAIDAPQLLVGTFELPLHPLRLLEQARVIQGDGALCGDAGDQRRMMPGESIGKRMPQKQAAQHLSGARYDGRRQPTPHRGICRISDPHQAFAAKHRRETRLAGGIGKSASVSGDDPQTNDSLHVWPSWAAVWWTNAPNSAPAKAVAISVTSRSIFSGSSCPESRRVARLSNSAVCRASRSHASRDTRSRSASFHAVMSRGSWMRPQCGHRRRAREKPSGPPR